MKLLDEYFDLQRQIFEHFGYAEDWRIIPLDDARRYYWQAFGEGNGIVRFADTEEELYRYHAQRIRSEWVYRASDYTMIVTIDTGDNKFLQVFDNAKERP